MVLGTGNFRYSSDKKKIKIYVNLILYQYLVKQVTRLTNIYYINVYLTNIMTQYQNNI